MQHDDLRAAHELLTDITSITHSPTAFESATRIWDRDLNFGNPLWNHLDAQSIRVDDSRGRAHVLAFTDHRLPNVGLVGYFACTTVVAGIAVLLEARRHLSRRVATIYGPVNGTITRDYRLNMADDVLFAGEPATPALNRMAFAAAEFATYNSYLTARGDKSVMNSLLEGPRLISTRYRLRPFGSQTFADDLLEYHNLMNAIFPHQSIYCPAISFEERAFNLAGSPAFDGRFSFFVDAAQQATPAGFVVAYPHDNHLVVKTVGVLPEHRRTRIFAELMRMVHQRALDFGLENAYYGLVREGNEVSKIVRSGVSITRRYATVSASSLR